MSILGDLWVPITSHCSRKRPAQSLNLLHLPNRHLLKSRSSNRVVIKAQKSKKTRPKSTILSRPFKRIWKWKVTQVSKKMTVISAELIYSNFSFAVLQLKITLPKLWATLGSNCKRLKKRKGPVRKSLIKPKQRNQRSSKRHPEFI